LRGEISAVETYRSALEKVTSIDVREKLLRCQSSHESRVQKLRAKITELGGKPAVDSGVWGAFAKLLQSSATLFGERAAIAALEEGEDHGRDDYRRGLEKLVDTNERMFVESLLAEEIQTHAIVSGLKHAAAEPHVTP
jgi:uncharacterized protein (TIGR02284 family)